MKKKIFITVNAIMLTICSLHAQDDNKKSSIGVSLGAAINYYYGPGDRNFGDYEGHRVNYQVNAMLGLAVIRDESDHRTMIAAFGGVGFNNSKTTSDILSDHGYTTSLAKQRNTNNFYQIEGGLLIAEVLRISTGMGQQNFDPQTLVAKDGTVRTDETSIKYNSTTVGFNFNLPAIVISINANFASGKDFNKTVITPSAGLMLRL